MSDPKCPTCENQWDGRCDVYVCTGRPGCVRAAPVPPGPATSGVDIVDRLRAIARRDADADMERPEDHTCWIAADEIAHLRAEVETLKVERDDADRRAGASERRLERVSDSLDRFRDVRRKMKRERGYDDNVSFDVVWAETCAKADRAARDLAVAEAVREACAVVVDDFASEAWCRSEVRIGSAVEKGLARRVRAIDLAAVLAGVGEDGK
jgi:hypothetical protein